MKIEFNLVGRRTTAERKAVVFEDRLTATAADVAGRFARGNVALQRGYVVTREQLDAERAALLGTPRR